MFSLIDNAKIVSVMHPIDKTGAAFTTEYISVKNARKVTWIIDLGVLTSTSNQAVTLKVADDASGTHNAAITASSVDLTLPYYHKTSSGDTLAKTTVASSTFNITKSSDSKLFIVELDVGRQKMGQFKSGSSMYNADYVAISVATPGAHACLASVIAIVSELRYQKSSPPTVIT